MFPPTILMCMQKNYGIVYISSKLFLFLCHIGHRVRVTDGEPAEKEVHDLVRQNLVGDPSIIIQRHHKKGVMRTIDGKYDS